jgi:hypothetical protein
MTVTEFKKQGKGIFIPESVFYDTKLTPEQRFILGVEKYNDIQFANDDEKAKFHGISKNGLTSAMQGLKNLGYL